MDRRVMGAHAKAVAEAAAESHPTVMDKDAQAAKDA